MKLDNVCEIIYLPSTNNTEYSLKLPKDTIIANVSELEEIEVNGVIRTCHVVSGKGLVPDSGKIEDVMKFVTPCASEVKSFLGMASFSRKFVPQFALHVAVK